MTSALITADGPFRFFQRETFCVSRGQQEYGGVERGTGLLIRLSKPTVYSMWGKRHLNVAFNTFMTFLYSFCTPKIFESGAVSFKLLLLHEKTALPRVRSTDRRGLWLLSDGPTCIGSRRSSRPFCSDCRWGVYILLHTYFICSSIESTCVIFFFSFHWNIEKVSYCGLILCIFPLWDE